MGFLSVIIIGIVIFLSFKFGGVLVGSIVSAVIAGYYIYSMIPTFYMIKGKKYFAQGNYGAAKRMYKKAIDTGRSKLTAKIEYAYILMRTGNFADAEGVLNGILCNKGIKPDVRGRTILQRCMCYYKQGNITEAVKDAEELYDDGFRSIMMYETLGYFKTVLAPKAKETFDFCMEAYDYANDDRDICDNLLICHYNRGEYEKAREISDKILEGNPKFVEAWYHAAQIDNKLKEYDAALEKLEHIKDCNRSHMTTISEEEIEELRAEITAKKGGK